MLSTALTGLRHATTRESFMAALIDAEKDFRHVRIDEEALQTYYQTLQVPQFIPAWHDYLSPALLDSQDRHYRLSRGFYEMMITASINCGYVERKPGGQAWKWERDGSGAAALVDKFREIHAAGLLPGIDARDRAAARQGLKAIFNGASFADRRIETLLDFIPLETRFRADNILSGALRPGKKFQFGFGDVLSVAHLNPGGFREDPLLKKASLALIMFAGFANGEGFDVDLDNIIIPVDYRGPQFLHNLGILRYSDALVTAMDEKKLFRETVREATEMRAAAMLASERLYRLKRREQETLKAPARFEWHHLDGEMWFGAKIFDKPANRLKPHEADQRKTLDGIAEAAWKRPGFDGFSRRSREHIYMNTFWI